jgi:hypothetical protein
VAPHTYREDTCGKAPKWAILGRGSVPLGLNKDYPTVTAMGTTVVDKHDGTYKISSR